MKKKKEKIDNINKESILENRLYWEEFVKTEAFRKLPILKRCEIKKALDIPFGWEHCRNNAKTLKAVEMQSKGCTREECLEEFYKMDGKKRGFEYYVNIFWAAKELLIERANSRMGENVNKEDIVALHLQRYERAWREATEVNLDGLELTPQEKRQLLLTHYVFATEVLQSKEKLLGMHNKQFKVQINNYFKKRNEGERVRYDWSKNTLKELLELRELIKVEEVNEEEVELYNNISNMDEDCIDIECEEIKDKEEKGCEGEVIPVKVVRKEVEKKLVEESVLDLKHDVGGLDLEGVKSKLSESLGRRYEIAVRRIKNKS